MSSKSVIPVNYTDDYSYSLLYFHLLYLGLNCSYTLEEELNFLKTNNDNLNIVVINFFTSFDFNLSCIRKEDSYKIYKIENIINYQTKEELFQYLQNFVNNY